MSNLDNIVNKIIADNEEKIKVLKLEANHQIQILKSEFDEKINDEKNSILRKFELNKTLELERIQSSTELKANNILLAKKQELIENIVEELKEKLNNISINEMYDFISSNLEKRNKSFEDEVILLPSRYESLKDKFKNIEITDDVKNGFVIKYKGIEENYTFDSLINYKKEELEEIIQKYFS